MVSVIREITRNYYKRITMYQHILKPIELLKPYENNPRVHSDKQIGQIVSSIKEFGFTNPVLIDRGDRIIAGHGRVLAASKLGITTIPCIILDGLTREQLRAYIIADNKLAENASWDRELLTSEIIELKEHDYDLALLGFNEEEILAILEPIEVPNFDQQETDSQPRLDKLNLMECPHCGETFDRKKAKTIDSCL